MPVDKSALREELAKALAVDLAVRERAYRTAREGATHEEAKPENDKDTRALEQSYLARGEALRIEELRGGLADVEAMALRAFGDEAPVALGALVEIEDDAGTLARFFVAPYGGGVRLEGGVQVVTPASPVGRAMIGARRGDECEVTLAGRRRAMTLVSVT